MTKEVKKEKPKVDLECGPAQLSLFLIRRLKFPNFLIFSGHVCQEARIHIAYICNWARPHQLTLCVQETTDNRLLSDYLSVELAL